MEAGWTFLGFGIGFGGFMFLSNLGNVLRKRSTDQVKIQELKTQEARELRLKAEAENHNHSSLLK